MNKTSLVLIGAGGHCKSCIDVIEAEGKYQIMGILDSKEKIGQQVLGYSITGVDEDISDLKEKEYCFLITVGQIKSAGIRKDLYHQLKSLNAQLATVISPHAIVSKYASIGEGSIIMHGVILNAGATVGVNAILNTSSTIEHDTKVGDHCHVSTHAVLNGEVVMGDEVFVGSGSLIRNKVKIVSNVVIGAGSVIIKDINEKGTFGGNPIKSIHHG